MIRVGVVMDPIGSVKFAKDTTLALLTAAQKRGWPLFYMELQDLYLEQGEPRARFRPLRVMDSAHDWYEWGEVADGPLAQFDVILMRKDPPFDNQFLYSTYILEAAEAAGALVVNKPQSLRDCNEKIFATQFPQCCPPVLVSRDLSQLKAFHRTHGDVIFKPLDGMGGSSIFRCRAEEPNLTVILETLTQLGERYIMGQRYLPEISQGDKRILVVDGVAIPYCLARVPLAGETRGNLAAGGQGRAQPLTERDQWIVDQIAPVLREKGLLFVGLDVIGDYLTEINVTSPTCVKEIDRAMGTDIGGTLMEAIEQRLDRRD